ncbi:MAG: orotidine 5'-phosphate decarboxylase / HUMPS family protein, partial [Halobaculum sp.]
ASGDRLYERIAALADLWNDAGNVGLVVGATAPEELAELREAVPELPFLVPGVGAQGGDAEAAVEYGLANGVGLVNSSRGIIFAGEERTRRGRGEAGDDDYFAAAGAAAKRLRDRLERHR